MGIHWNCLAADTLSRTSVAAPVPDLDSDSDSDSDSPRDSILKLVDVDASPMDSAEYSCCFTMVTACISTWMSNAPLSGENNVILGALDNSKLRDFTYEELRAATFNFSMNLLIGRGGFGNVYKGWLKEQMPSKGARNRAIAVKRLSGRSRQGYLEFTTEISLLGMVSHPNILKVLGFCRANEEKILVYEYMQKRGLDYHLFSKKPERVLSWEIRLKIAIEIAEGLSYLHTLEHPIIFRDMKPSNILLDKSYTAKIADFGLAITAPAPLRDHDEYIQEDRIVGTYGYMDPLYAQTGELCVKSDVYGFGVVLVQLLTGSRLTKNINDDQTVGEWAEKYLSNRFRLRGIMDSRLEGKYVTGQASEIAMLALRCLVRNPKFRPSMKEVAETLEKIKTRAYNQKHLVMCGKCHKAGHYTRSCDKNSHVGGNSKLPNASEAITEERTSSTQSTVQQDSGRSEASDVVTKTLQTTPSNSNLLDASNGTSNEKTSTIQSPHPQQGSKRDEANRVGTSKPRNNHLIRKTTAVGGNSKVLEARNTTKKEKTTSSRLSVQQGNTRKEANGVATSPSCNNGPKTKIPRNSKLLNATDAMKKEKISTTKSIVQIGKKRNEANGVGTSTPRSKGKSELPNASNVARKVKASVQQVNERNVAADGGICIK
uniref:non-specific serine/threonine protein kinase n=1 Tax=Populus trichocarpa TaxID=3694 RepID=A0A3N7GBH9_POPTR